MQLVPLPEFGDEDWYMAHQMIFDPELNQVMGSNPQIYQNPPGLVQFFQNSQGAYERGETMGWLVKNSEGRHVGFVLLDRQHGEWELGVGLVDSAERQKGLGVRAVIHALRWAFEEKNASWVTAFTQGRDLRVPRMIERFGFKRLYHFWVMDKPTWNEKWAGRVA